MSYVTYHLQSTNCSEQKKEALLDFFEERVLLEHLKDFKSLYLFFQLEDFETPTYHGTENFTLTMNRPSTGPEACWEGEFKNGDETLKVTGQAHD